MFEDEKEREIAKTTYPKGWYILALVGLACLYLFKQESPKPLPPITHILVEKGQRQMTVYHGDKVLKTYPIVLGFEPNGPKQAQNDGKTPEGNYKIITKNNRSKFHLSLKISYPNEKDLKQAAAKNLPAGNDIMIHGLGNGLGWIGRLHTVKDWTRGCIAVTNPEIEEIYAATPLGTSIEIRP